MNIDFSPDLNNTAVARPAFGLDGPWYVWSIVTYITVDCWFLHDQHFNKKAQVIRADWLTIHTAWCA